VAARCRGSCLDAGSVGEVLSIRPQSMAGAALPLSADVQSVFHRSGSEVRRRARSLARCAADLPLSSLGRQRI